VTAIDRVMLFDEDAERAASIASSLGSIGLTSVPCPRDRDAVSMLRSERPAVAVVVGGDARFPGLTAVARPSGVATLAVIEPNDDPRAMAASVRTYDDWTPLSASSAEIAARVAGLLDRGANRGSPASTPRPPSIDSRFLGLVVHDLRTPLNVIVLTIRSLGLPAPRRADEFHEDLRNLTENTRQIERMLAQLGDYCRLIELESILNGTEFDPRRFLTDFLEDRKERNPLDPTPVRLELTESCPREVALDPIRVRLALHYALANTVAAAGRSPVRLRASGKPGRLVVEMILDTPPAETVRSVDLRSESFERLVGIAAERRGLDLAIAARVSELFGRTARLVVEPGRRSTVVLEWPDRIGAA
jgi:signal transduction histidine kinase